MLVVSTGALKDIRHDQKILRFLFFEKYVNILLKRVVLMKVNPVDGATPFDSWRGFREDALYIAGK